MLDAAWFIFACMGLYPIGPGITIFVFAVQGQMWNPRIRRVYISTMSDAPLRRFALLVLFQAQQDNATDLIVAPSPADGEAAIKCKVGEKWYDFSPPPAHILPGVVAELWELAKPTTDTFPKESTVDEPYSGIRLKWTIRCEKPDGPCWLSRAIQKNV